jgi:hypothetical protein
MVVVTIDSRPEYAQQTLVAISPRLRMAYPLPFDFFSSSFSENEKSKPGLVVYSIDSNEICIRGEIMAYKTILNDNLCWKLSSDQFSGEITPYTYPDH